MTNLKNQLKEIQKKLAKIDIYNRICENLRKETDESEEFPGLLKEVADEVILFCNRRISEIEGGATTTTPKKEVTAEVVKEVSLPVQEKPKQTTEVLHDPLKFIVTYKTWIGKKVMVSNGNNGNVEGEVLAAAFPNLKVRVNDTVIIVNPLELQLK